MPTRPVLSQPVPPAPQRPQQGIGLLHRAQQADAHGQLAGYDAPACSFVSQQVPASLATLLAEHTDLAGYATVFESAQIDAELAADLSVRGMHSLLGDSAPLGHALKLRRIFAAAAQTAQQPRPVIPAEPSWQMLSRAAAVGVCDDKLTDSFILIQEVVIISSSLYMSLCLPSLLSLPSECEDGECHALRSVDAVLWAIATACFVCSTGGAWIMIMASRSVSDTHLAKWYEGHLRQIILPATLFVVGVTVTPAAVCTRLLTGTLGGSKYSAAARWTVIAIIAVVGFVGQWSIWITTAKRTLGVAWREFPSMKLGASAVYLSKRSGEERKNVPYVDLKRE
jgi:hypothetical protein